MHYKITPDIGGPHNRLQVDLVPASESLNEPFSLEEEIASHLRTAANYLTSKNPVYGSAVWRVADAGLLLRELIETRGSCLDRRLLETPTGRGAVLPKYRDPG